MLVDVIGVTAPKKVAADTSSGFKLKNILLTTDFSPASTAAEPYAINIAKHYGATVHAVASAAASNLTQ